MTSWVYSFNVYNLGLVWYTWGLLVINQTSMFDAFCTTDSLQRERERERERERVERGMYHIIVRQCETEHWRCTVHIEIDITQQVPKPNSARNTHTRTHNSHWPIHISQESTQHGHELTWAKWANEPASCRHCIAYPPKPRKVCVCVCVCVYKKLINL